MRSALALCALVLAGCAADQGALRVDSPYRAPSTLAKGQILHAATGRLLTQAELIEYLAPYPVVYVGEAHDSVDDHAVQLAILRGLQERFPGEVALGLEMLRRPFQAEVDAYLRGDTDEKAFLRVWEKNWSPRSFPYYRDLLHYAREHRLPVVALNAGNDLKAAVREKGLDGLPPDLAARLPEMDLEDPHHRAFIGAMFGGHASGSSQPEVFYRVQVLWDETMAQSAAEYLQGPGQGKRLVVLAGGNHVRYGFGIPRRLFRRVPLPYAVVDPYAVEIPEKKRETLMDVDPPALPLRAADVYWAVGYEDLEDDRVMLGIQVADAEGGGVKVTGVLPDSPGLKAGLREGDVIVSVDGAPVVEVFDLTYQVGLHKPGDTGPLEVTRGGERLTLQVAYDVVRHGR